MVWRKIVLGCTEVGVHFLPPEDQKVNSGLRVMYGLGKITLEGEFHDEIRASPVPLWISK
jgi:hypothetical protein